MDDLAGPAADLAAELRKLRDRAGRPGYRQMAARVNYSVATLSAAASGRRLPTLEVTLAYVAACDGDPVEWERRWRQAERLGTTPPGDQANGNAPVPYPGLVTFQAGDAELFFGRAAMVADLVRRLGQRRFLTVFGPSGAGKSSVVRAGLVPAVEGPALVLTPGAHPMAELAVHLARVAGVPAGGLLDELREDPARAGLLVRQSLSGVPPEIDLLIVVDQFEEVFAGGVDAGERADFVAALLATCREPGGRARVVLVVRADHYARFAEYPQLLAVLSDAQVLIGGMSPAELREAVTRPAERCGARVEGALVATIVAEVSGSPGALPLAAHALREAWRRRQGAIVTLAGYQAAGGVAGSVAHTAEQAYEALSGPERHAARQTLLRMVDVGPDGLVTRRRLGRAELDTIVGAPAVIDTFTAARLVSADRDTVEIAHEALIQAWPRLHGWVEESRAGLRLHRLLTEAAAAWESLGRDEGALYRGPRLSAAAEAADLRVIDLTGPERDFLEAGRALHDREQRVRRRRTRILVFGLVAVLALVSTAAVVAVVSARRAEAQRIRAVAGQLAAGARAERMTDPELALLLARRAYQVHPDPETESVLRQATADARSIRTMDAHRAEVSSLAVSGSTVADVDLDGVVKVWDLDSPAPPVTAPTSGGAVDLGPDGRLAIASSDPGLPVGRVVLWRPRDPGPPRLLRPFIPAGVSEVAYSPDGRWVAAISANSHVYLWNTTRDGPGRRFRSSGQDTDLAFGPGGRLAVASFDGTVRVWDVDGTDAPAVLRQPAGAHPVAVAVSRDGNRIAVAGTEQVTVWPADGRGEPEIHRGPEHSYLSVAFSPDGRRVAAGTSERTVRIWGDGDTSDGLAMRGHRGPVRQVAFSADGRRLLSGSDDTTVRVWDTSGAADPALIALPASAGGPAALSRDGAFTVAGTISVFPTRTPGDATELRNVPAGRLFSAVSADGRSVASANLDSEQIHWWRDVTGEPTVVECTRRPGEVTVNAVALSDNGRELAVDCGNDEILWSAGDGHAAVRIDGHGPIAVSRDLIAIAMANSVVLWEPATGGLVRTLKGQNGRADQVRFSAEGDRIAVAGDDGAIRIWPVAQDHDPVVLTGTVGRTVAMSFSPDGRLIAAIGTDNVVRLWHTDGSGEPVTFDHPAEARQLEFSADGRSIITLYGTTVRITPCEVCGPVGEVVALAGQRVTRDFTARESAKYLREPG
ncbi:hypothetical protein GCM10010112_93750 [Actinoplanes lobatus]|uniref:WD40 repeat protein n=1 Tax=Actinoplanes lobatus TaxID=113568 RepID=A0A7W7HKT7_9ACTN|nr:hypothetical protein [Actinoplanes lobatus]MBB4752334.1 WD40 repeat protein [Actinoplanes lobatus]GGN99718.1 hypothetical protein GCM10010112_93750 [Actinoplanes lobatus]GIE46421.1 hypothetical protein Alo02nite_93190 [Actinoplanes lobatus]